MSNHPATQRAMIAAVQILGLSVWFSATAVVPSLSADWQITSGQAVWLTASVQLGFVCGALTSALLNLADRIKPSYLLAASTAAAATCTLVFALVCDSFATGVPLRFLTGVFLAGIYPVGMKLTASWSTSANRGMAFGLLIGALTLGSALPHLISGLGELPWRAVMASAAAVALLAAVVSAVFITSGPNLAPQTARPNVRYLVEMFRQRGPRLANLGYVGHMWELYAWWTWLAIYLSHALGGDLAHRGAELITFAAIGVAGFVGCLLGGLAADRFGRSRAAVVAMVVSGCCCVLSPLLFGAPPWLLVPFLAVWGVAVIADSGVFSTALSETSDARYVGTALTAQTAIGFTLTVVSIQLVPLLVELVGWRYAFLILAPGPLLGAIAMHRFQAIEPSRRNEEEHHAVSNQDRPDCRSDGGAVAHSR